jgi:hypothetical protein
MKENKIDQYPQYSLGIKILRDLNPPPFRLYLIVPHSTTLGPQLQKSFLNNYPFLSKELYVSAQFKRVVKVYDGIFFHASWSIKFNRGNLMKFKRNISIFDVAFREDQLCAVNELNQLVEHRSSPNANLAL